MRALGLPDLRLLLGHVPAANSMNCLAEALGLALPGNGTVPAVYSERLRLAKEAGMRVNHRQRPGARREPGL